MKFETHPVNALEYSTITRVGGPRIAPGDLLIHQIGNRRSRVGLVLGVLVEGFAHVAWNDWMRSERASGDSEPLPPSGVDC